MLHQRCTQVNLLSGSKDVGIRQTEIKNSSSELDSPLAAKAAVVSHNGFVADTVACNGRSMITVSGMIQYRYFPRRNSALEYSSNALRKSSSLSIIHVFAWVNNLALIQRSRNPEYPL